MNISESSTIEQKLSELVKCKTISYNSEEDFSENEFSNFLKILKTMFPNSYSNMENEYFNNFAHVLKWQGSNKDLDPILFIAHFDVVPIDNEEEWIHKPFDGDVADGFVWGRGTLDIKNQLCAIMQACELLIDEDFKPERTIYLAWGGDEEVSGSRGAKVIAKEFKNRGLRFAFLMDEGGAISTDQLSMIKKPVAVIGVEEKGVCNLRLSCTGQTGHSSMPPDHTAIGTLSEAIRIIESKPFPTRLTKGTRGLFEAVAPHTTGIYRLIFSNLNIFGKLLVKLLTKNYTTNAMVRTSQSVNIIKGGYKENVLPDRAECIINFRIIPGESIQSVEKRIERLVKKLGVKVEISYGFSPNEPCMIKSLDTPYFVMVCDNIKKVWSNAIPAPYLVMGGTDSKNYDDITDNIFRFSPMLLDKNEMMGMHGINERISIENLHNMVSFYQNIIRDSCS